MIKKKIDNKKEVIKKTAAGIPLGVLYFKGKMGLLERDGTRKGKFKLAWSTDGISFTADKKDATFLNGLTLHKAEECDNFRFSTIGKKHYAVYARTLKSKVYRVLAESTNIYEWEIISETLLANVPGNAPESVLVSYPETATTTAKNQIIYEGGTFIKCLVGKNKGKWDDDNSLLFTTRHDRFDRDSIKLIGSFLSDKGIVLLYESMEIKSANTYDLCIGAVIFDKDDPRKIVWRSPDPVWKSDIPFSKKNICTSLGLIVKDENIYFFFSIDGIVINLFIETASLSLKIPEAAHKLFVKHTKNPIISPDTLNHWENRGLCNPATIVDDNGYVHLLYRAVGSDGVSRIGYGFSEDGIHFTEREIEPIFSMSNPARNIKKSLRKWSPVMYPSGGSWGGCEDPRAVRIDGRIYVTFNAFDNWDFIRVAIISMDEEDFFKKEWNWSRPLLISPAKEINKNWVLFPEKIRGKFALLHTVWPKIGIAYVNKLEELADGSKKIEKIWDIPRSHHHLPENWTEVYGGTPGAKWVHKKHFEESHWNKEKGWDLWVRSAGPPPIKTDKGWLVLYHAGDEREQHIGYKLGAMLLDLDNPEKIIARSKKPLVVPEKWYENDWKPGVIYACGAVVKKNVLYIYYGGGDKHVCVAVAPLNKFLNDLIKK